MKDVFFWTCVISSAASVAFSILMALFFGQSPFASYMLIYEFESSNPSDLFILFVLYLHVPLWILYLIARNLLK